MTITITITEQEFKRMTNDADLKPLQKNKRNAVARAVRWMRDGHLPFTVKVVKPKR